MRLNQGNGGPDGRPRCFNAEPMREYRAHAGYDDEGRLRTVMIPWAFSRECKSWASHPGSDPVPLAEGCFARHRNHSMVDLAQAAAGSDRQ